MTDKDKKEMAIIAVKALIAQNKRHLESNAISPRFKLALQSENLALQQSLDWLRKVNVARE